MDLWNGPHIYGMEWRRTFLLVHEQHELISPAEKESRVLVAFLAWLSEGPKKQRQIHS